MFKIAYKNLMRNMKRSLLTIVIIIVATAGMIFGISWVSGEENLFIESGKKNTGDLRITNKDFEIRSRTFDISSNFSYDMIENKIEKKKYGVTTVGRIRFGGLVYFDETHENALGSGIELADKDFIGFDDYIYEGNFLKTDDDIIIGETIKRKLGLKLGDVVTILTQTQGKSLYSLNYTIVGFYKMDNSRLNKSFYVTLSSAQYLLDMEGEVTEFLFFLDDEKNVKPLQTFLANDSEISKDLEVKKWSEIGINEGMSQTMPFIKSLFLLIFSILAGLSISNTMLMIVFERRHEIGLLKSLGVKEKEIKKLFLLEGIYMGIIGSFIGILLGSILSLYLGDVGVSFGDSLENITNELNTKGVIYPALKFSTIILTFTIAMITSVLATFTAVAKEVKKEAVVNMRNL